MEKIFFHKVGSILGLCLTAFFPLSLAWAQSIPATLSWQGNTNGIIFSSPVIDDDGVIYVGSNDNNLTAFNPDGGVKWTFPTGNWVDSSPALSKDGNTVYVGSWDNFLYAINCADGSLVWRFETNSYVTSSPAVGLDGRIYFGSMDSIFYALESNGSLAWEYFAGQPVFSSPAIGGDGTLYFGDENGTLHAVNQDGSTKWTYEVEDAVDANKSILSSPALDASGNIYFGSGNGYCYSLSDDQTEASLNWQYLTGDRVDSSPVLGINEDVFFVSRDGYMRSLPTFSATTENLPNWEVFTGDVFYSTPVVDENGRVYVVGYTGGGENHLFAFDHNGTKAWDSNVTSPPFEIPSVVDSSLLLSDEGKLYFGCFDKKLYCIDIGVGPANSAWPMFGRTNRRDRDWPSHSLSISVSGNTGGSVTGSGTYYEGSSASISATPNTGYSFAGWTGEGIADHNASSTTVSMTQARTVSAAFSLNSYDLTVLAGNGGTVSGTDTYNHGTTPTITATPNTGYSFAGWTGEGIADHNASSTTVSMTQARTVSAAFSLNSYDLTVLAGIGGSVSGTDTYNHGTTPTISATPNTGYSFAGWTGEGIADHNASSTTVSMTQARTVSAAFSLNSYDLTVLAGNGGTVSGTDTYNHGDNPTITATPNTGYSFAGWTGEGVADHNASSTTVSMTQARTVSAAFSLNSYGLTVLAGNGGTVSGTDTYNHGTTPPISATPNTGYSFAGWTGEGVSDHNASSTTVSMTQARTVSAAFSLNSYLLNVVAGDGGTVSGEGSYSHGSLVNISATPDSGYSFQSWSGSGISDPHAPSTTVLLTSDLNVSALFSFVPVGNYSLTLTSSPASGGIVTGGGNYADERNVSISAVPLNGYTFEKWSGHILPNADEANTSLIIDSNISLTAHFLPVIFSLEVQSSTGGVATGSGDYTYATEANISAEPDNGYSFAYWEGEGINNPFAQQTTVTVSEALNVRAVFTPLLYQLSTVAQTGGSATFTGTNPFPFGSSVKIDAVPANGYTFTGWTGQNIESASSASTTLTISGDTNITATFEPSVKNTYSLIVLQNLSQAGTVLGGGFYEEGQFVQISASSSPGYQFSHWLGSNIENPLSPETQIFIDSDALATAKFVLSELSVFLECKFLDSQWFSSWMGSIYQTNNGWVYQYPLGWIYPKIHASGIWLWQDSLGWLWTKKTIYSENFIWIENSQDWGYLDFESGEEVRLYDYNSSKWTNWPE